MTSVSAGHIILTPTQPVGSGRPQRESNPGPPHQESPAIPSYRAPLGGGRGGGVGERKKEAEQKKEGEWEREAEEKKDKERRDGE